jgi:hypothetical protein
LDSRVVDWRMAYNPTFVILSSLNSLFFNSIKNQTAAHRDICGAV